MKNLICTASVVLFLILTLGAHPLFGANVFLIVRDSPSSLLYLIENRGDGTFADKTVFPSTESPAEGHPIAVADFEHDRDLDVVTFHQGDLSLFLNDGEDVFEKIAIGYSGPTLVDTQGESGDFDGDGKTDFLLSQSDSYGNAALFIYLNNGDAAFTAVELDVSWYLGVGSDCCDGLLSFGVGDFNEDGNLDFLILWYRQRVPSDVYLYAGDGNGDFSWSLSFSSTISYQATGMLVGDFNEDGHEDAIVGQDDDLEPGQTWLYVGDGTGQFTYFGEAYDTNPAVESGEDQPGAGQAFAFDFDRDGHLDVAASAGRIGILLFKGNGDGSFVEPGVFIDDSIYGTIEGPRMLDFDGDGLVDAWDNCPYDPNPDQVDGDEDGHGIACDCDDADPLINPDVHEHCDAVDWDCSGDPLDRDVDGDGHIVYDPVCEGDDCDDENPDTYAGALEICDGEDNDCDDLLPDDEADTDQDDLMACEGDCDDTDPLVKPGLEESYLAGNCGDGKDNDCDGLADTDPECIAFLVPEEHPTIQGGIDAAQSKNMVLVAPGIYQENIDFLGKNLKVHSLEGPGATIIDGGQSGSAVVFTHGETQEAVLDGFTLQNGNGTFITIPYVGAGFYAGGGIFCEGSSPTITNCKIANNYAYFGGGIYLRASAPTITNCMILKNWATGIIHGGGGIYIENSSPMITNCTLSANFADQYGGGIFCWNSSPTITNSILWSDYSIFDPEIHVRSGSPIVTYCDVEGGWSGEGNIDLNPLFFGGGSYHLRAVSACVDAGTDAGVYTDFDGQDRPWGAGFDMGADEFSTEPCSVIASTGNQFLALYLIPAFALIFFSRRFLRW